LLRPALLTPAHAGCDQNACPDAHCSGQSHCPAIVCAQCSPLVQKARGARR
jgi:hypothetical protein